MEVSRHCTDTFQSSDHNIHASSTGVLCSIVNFFQIPLVPQVAKCKECNQSAHSRVRRNHSFLHCAASTREDRIFSSWITNPRLPYSSYPSYMDGLRSPIHQFRPRHHGASAPVPTSSSNPATRWIRLGRTRFFGFVNYHCVRH